MIFRGWALVWDKLSVDLGGFREKISRRAIQRTFDEKADVHAFVAHDSAHVLGRMSAGTLKLEADNVGLRARIDAPDTQPARDLAESVKRGDVSGMSFGFAVLADEWHLDDSKNLIRTVTDMQLVEVSPVAMPAYPQTAITVSERALSAADEAAIAKLRADTAAALAEVDAEESDARPRIDRLREKLAATMRRGSAQ
jgi:HK97 family phage prohead protease